MNKTVMKITTTINSEIVKDAHTWKVDEDGYLILFTESGGTVAVYGRNHWVSARLVIQAE